MKHYIFLTILIPVPIVTIKGLFQNSCIFSPITSDSLNYRLFILINASERGYLIYNLMLFYFIITYSWDKRVVIGVKAFNWVVIFKDLVGLITKLTLKVCGTRVGGTSEVETWGINILCIYWTICYGVFISAFECFSCALFSYDFWRF